MPRWSGQAEQLYGWSADEAIGRPLVDLVGSGMYWASAEESPAHPAARKSWIGVVAQRHRHGRLLDVVVTSTWIRNADFEVIEIVSVCRPAWPPTGERPPATILTEVLGPGEVAAYY